MAGEITDRPRLISSYESEIVGRIEKLFSELTTYRNVLAGQLEEAAALLVPTARNTFFYGSYNFPGQKKTQQQIDASGALALSQFCAIADSLITPKNDQWHGLKSDPYVMKDRATRQFFQELTEILFDYRYRPQGNFHGQNFNNWQSLGAFGNSIMYVDALDTRWHGGAPGLRYRSVPFGECFFAENHQGIVTTLVRWWRMTAPQAVEKFGYEWLPATLKPALDQNLQTPFNFLHCVMPRSLDEYDPERLDVKGKPFVSYYMSIEGKCLMAEEGGYRTFPYAVSRYDQTPGEVYGRGPAQIVLPALKTLNAEKAIFLKTGHRAGDPVLLAADDGLVDALNQRPGAVNKGGVTADGKPLVHILPTGEIQITKEMMDEERSIIEQTFLTSLFKTLLQNPNMTATQVIELLNERGMLVAPTLGRQHAEYVGGLVPREIGLLQLMRVGGKPIIPPMPPRLREAMGHYEVDDTSPLSKSAKFNRVSGGNRWIQQLHDWAAITGDVSILDPVNFRVAVPESGRIQGVPETWICTDKEIAQKGDNRARAQAQQQQLDALPGKAAIMNAQSKIAKAGGQQPGQPQQPQPVAA